MTNLKGPYYSFASDFAIGDRVNIDSDTSIRGIVTAIIFRNEPAPVAHYEVSWVHNGASQVAWFEGERLKVIT